MGSMSHQGTVQALEALKRQIEDGEIAKAAVRVFYTDGSHEDLVLGDMDDEDREALLQELRSRAGQ